MRLTEKAVQQIKKLNTENATLRVRVVGGGCSGLSYKLNFENDPPLPSDKLVEIEGIKLVVDEKSHLFIADMTLDFSEGLDGIGFIFNNPNAKRTCGCGSSFSS